jgi:hypothetical protein
VWTFAGSNNTLFTLPAGYRPAIDWQFKVVVIEPSGANSTGTHVLVLVNATDGTIKLSGGIGSVSPSGSSGSYCIIDEIDFDTGTVIAMPTGPKGDTGGNATVPMDTWHTVGTTGEPAFANGWRQLGGSVGQYGPASFRKDPLGFVMLKGLIDKNGGNWIPGETIFTLPTGYWPQCILKFEVAGYSSTGGWFGTVQATVLPSGAVQLGDHGGAANPVGWLNFSEILFDTGTVTAMPTGPKGDTGATGGNATVPLDTWHTVGAAGEPAFNSSWRTYPSGYGNVGFHKDPLGRVWFRGLLGATANHPVEHGHLHVAGLATGQQAVVRWS